MIRLRWLQGLFTIFLLTTALFVGCSQDAPNIQPETLPIIETTTTPPTPEPESTQPNIISITFGDLPSVLPPGSKIKLHIKVSHEGEEARPPDNDKEVQFRVTSIHTTTTTSANNSSSDNSSNSSNVILTHAANAPTATIDSNHYLHIDQEAATGERLVVQANYLEHTDEFIITIKASPEDTVEVNSIGNAVILNPVDRAVMVNKQRNLPEYYIPPDLVEVNVPFSFKEASEKKKLRAEAAEALEELFAQAQQDEIKLYGVSGYRSYATQRAIFNYNIKVQGEEVARQYSAEPGQSEHQTGLAIDVSSESAKFGLTAAFADTDEGKWLAAHAHEFGFIIRYPLGKEQITGYAYEPWHIRYVGTAIAADLYKQQITLEEYFLDALPVSTFQ